MLLTVEGSKTEEFVDFINSRGGEQINAIVQPHLKPGKNPPAGYFQIQRTIHGLNPLRGFERNNIGDLYIDGDEGFVLISEENGESPLVIAALSFTLYPGRISALTNAQDRDGRVYPRTLQLQACTSRREDNRKRYSRVMQILDTVYFERVLVDIVIGLANFTQANAFGILPAEFNPNKKREAFDPKRVYRRYDETAKSYGMTKPDNTDLYVKNLQY